MRLLVESQDAYNNMAEDAALTELSSEPTLRLYTWRPIAVSIGYFQSISDEVDEEFCRAHGIDVVRRMTGGGAVFHDDEITYSFVCPIDRWESIAEGLGKNGKNVRETFELVCNCLVIALENLGLNAKFRGINDVEVNGKKISGSAQTMKKGSLLQHGTLIYEIDEDLMFKALRIGKEKISDKGIKSAEARVTSIKRELGDVGKDRITEALAKGFSSGLGVDVMLGELSEKERNKKEELRTKFVSREWNYQR
jgi:lipoate-protein ligase A